jgi:hypothetical protein
MRTNELQEINLLWRPVRPYLMKQIQELYGRNDGDILEIGPFSGLIFAFAQQYIGGSFTIAAFPENTVALLRDEALSLDLTGAVTVVSSDPLLQNIQDSSVDLVIFRGALFFPSLFRTDFPAVYRVLKPQGLAFVGGGFGSYTPPELIQQIGERSRKLNLAIGKVVIEPDNVRKTLAETGLGPKAEVITDGGLWAVIRK